ncbi:hypothetical protein C0W92_13815 [Photobacterium angustum]|uniref:Uncharacterized protein n=1 Tax=Photobacterium angustum TaxID=661 RepID=A0A855SAI2_PHOAN|nr:hypothetical protein UB36_17135 [Photobacterium damselae subsp. damselae]KJG28190.1 hypothetical protein UA69_17110 [Photobacterium angustum]KJG37320.1 hypothetical protein UA35_17590 [Photobacterium angustum]KJG43936.1 hypothetical protein UA31_17140 [Photobacterium angustum]KJG46702.1 hypothetical protein UA30_17035 [Photobacterium angustum]
MIHIIKIMIHIIKDVDTIAMSHINIDVRITIMMAIINMKIVITLKNIIISNMSIANMTIDRCYEFLN